MEEKIEQSQEQENNKKIEINVPTVKLSHLRKMVKNLKETCGKDAEVSFEYVLASCFPTCWNNIQEALAREHTLGYLQAKKEFEENLKSE
jgi:hypothetical protein